MKSTQRFWSEVIARDDRLHLRLGKSVVTKDLGDFLGFDVSQIYGLANFAEAFGCVVLEVRLRGQITAEPHGNRPGGNLRETCGDHDTGRADRTSESRRECERHRQPVGHPNHDVANGCRGCKVFFFVFDRQHPRLLSPAEI